MSRREIDISSQVASLLSLFNGDWTQGRCQHFRGDRDVDRTAIAREAADVYTDAFVTHIAQLARPVDSRWQTHEEIQCGTCGADLCHGLMIRAFTNICIDEIDEILASDSEGEEQIGPRRTSNASNRLRFSCLKTARPRSS